MPIVVVHGVNTRNTEPGYKARLALITSLLGTHLAGATVNGKAVIDTQPDFPYWGDFAASFAWDMASLPTGQIDSLGGGVDADLRPLVAVIHDALGDLQSAQAQPLLTLARKSLPQSVAVLSDALIQSASDHDADRVAAFVASAQAYAEANPNPAWVATVTTDPQFLNRLVTEITGPAPSGFVQPLGAGGSIINALSSAAAKLKNAVTSAANAALDRTGDFASTKFLAWERRPLNGILGRFFGDVFVYLDTRGDRVNPGQILQVIMNAIRQAAARKPGEPLIVIAHSLGGVICFDLLSFYCPDVAVDLFVTVGSQVSQFEEIKRFKTSDPAIPSARRPRAAAPGNIRHWVNVFDEVDIFAYACDKVFDRVIDFRYDTRTYTIKAHGAYLEQDRFYSRLRARIDQLP